MLQLPAELISLVANGAWPLTENEANRQNLLTGPIPPALVEELVPRESSIFLYPPPFRTIAERCAGAERKFWQEFGALDQIDPGCTLLLGDFGLGSDTAIALDYRQPDSPPLLRLAWAAATPKRTYWIPFFVTFAAFAHAFRLADRRWR